MPTVNTIPSTIIVKTVMGSGSTDWAIEDRSQALLLFLRQYPTVASQSTPLDATYLFLLYGQQLFSPCFCSSSRFPFGSFQPGQDQEACFPMREKRQSVKLPSHLLIPCKPQTTATAYLPGASCRHLQEGRNRDACFIFIRGHGWPV